MKNKQIHIIGGGTVNHVRPHLGVTAPAYGTVAKQIGEITQRQIPEMDTNLHLTKMATRGQGHLETNEDIQTLVNELVADYATKIIFFTSALTDYHGSMVENGIPTQSGKDQNRLLSRDGEQNMLLTPSEKVINSIRRETRKDIFLVGFKTTAGASEDEQYITGLNLVKGASANLVLANDIHTRTNMIITPEEARYHVSQDRQDVLENLVDMANLRSQLGFTRSNVVSGEPIGWDSSEVPGSLRDIVNHCIDSGAYKPFRGATVGHFAFQIDENTFGTSKRKTNFNDLQQHGLVKIVTDGPDSVTAYGAKPSVGGQSQRIIFSENPGLDCIVHFHCPKRENSQVPTVSQREFECGSHECGQNTSSGLKDFDGIHAVYLDNHGPNIVFNRDIAPERVIAFIEDNFDLHDKTGGPVVL